jgi:hypothetical protein
VGEPQPEEKALQERLSDTNKQATSKRICSYKAITKETTKACNNQVQSWSKSKTAEQATNVRLLSDVEWYVRMIRSDACLATETQQLYLHSSHV